MTLSLYDMCPCGSGKKIKFCCRDLAEEIEKIERMIATGQPHACLEHIERLEKKYPDRVYLQTRKAELLRQLGDPEAARSTLQQALQRDTENPAVLAEAALAALQKGDLSSGIAWLHRGIATGVTKKAIPAGVMEALQAVCDAAIDVGEFFVAHGHLALIFRFMPDHEGVRHALSSFRSSPFVPLLAKEPLRPEFPADDHPQKGRFFEAIRPFAQHDWIGAEQSFAKLSHDAPSCWQAWHNLAVLRTWLGDNVGAAEAWRREAALDVPPAQAALAEAIALELLPPDEVTDIRQVEIPVTDQAALLEALRAAGRISERPVAPQEWEGPPPRAAYHVLDKPVPSADVTPTAENVPAVIGLAFFFGKETDREPRLELQARGGNFEAAKAAIVEAGGAALGAALEAQALGQVYDDPLAQLERRFPDHATVDQIFEVYCAVRRRALVDEWPARPSPVFGGKTPQEAAADGELRRRLLGYLLRLECRLDQKQVAAFDFGELYQRLGLQAWPPVTLPPVDEDEPDAEAESLQDEKGDAAAAGQAADETARKHIRALRGLSRLNLTDLARLDLAPLDNDGLTSVYTYASAHHAVRTIYRIGCEVLRREGVSEYLVAPVLATLPYLCEDTRRGLEFIAEGRKRGAADTALPVELDFAEMQIHYQRSDGEDVMRLVDQIGTRHIKKPGVRDRLLSFLIQAGMVRPTGEPAEPAGEAAPVVAAPPEEGKIWVPGGEGPSAPGGGKIWVPE
ncbi:MAG: hypothetical protein HYS13_03375 [Planctomycetia bacterium]|nr:hypothetical protein [Planctomycetia bacterium]